MESHGPVEKVKEEKSQHSYSQSTVKQIVALVPGMSSRQDSGNKKTQYKAESYGQQNTGQSQIHFSQHKMPLSIAEHQFTDKGAKTGGKHTDMEILFIIQFFNLQVQKDSQKWRPHVKKIQSVEAVSYHQEVACQCIGPGWSL